MCNIIHTAQLSNVLLLLKQLFEIGPRNFRLDGAEEFLLTITVLPVVLSQVHNRAREGSDTPWVGSRPQLRW